MPTSTSEEELCINGMSFSRWAAPPGHKNKCMAGTAWLAKGGLNITRCEMAEAPGSCLIYVLSFAARPAGWPASGAASHLAPMHFTCDLPLPLTAHALHFYLYRRDSKWANSALVVTVQPADWAHLLPRHGPLAGMALQQEVRGPGCLGRAAVCPRG